MAESVAAAELRRLDASARCCVLAEAMLRKTDGEVAASPAVYRLWRCDPAETTPKTGEPQDPERS